MEGIHKLSEIAALSEADVRELIQAADSDHNGMLDFAEFVAATLDREVLLSNKNLLAAFKTIDSNKDGFITEQELRQVFGNKEAILDKLLVGVDRSEELKVNYQEFCMAVRTHIF